MWKKLLLLTLAVAGALAGAVARRPATVRVERSAAVAAPPEAILGLVADLRRWPEWSPAARAREGVERRTGGPPSGVGSSAFWTGGDAAGRLTVVAAGPSAVDVELEEERPARRFADLEIRLASAPGGALVRWAIAEEQDLAARLRAVFRSPLPALEAEADLALEGLSAAARSEAAAQAAVQRIERSLRIAAPPGAVLAELQDLRRWASWAPWQDADAGAERRYGGPAAGPGASWYWSGGEATGQGRVTIVAAAGGRLEVELETERPERALRDLELEVAPEGGGTRVRWRASGEVPPGGRLASLEEDLGPQLERGLARLKAVVEAEGRGHARIQ